MPVRPRTILPEVHSLFWFVGLLIQTFIWICRQDGAMPHWQGSTLLGIALLLGLLFLSARGVRCRIYHRQSHGGQVGHVAQLFQLDRFDRFMPTDYVPANGLRLQQTRLSAAGKLQRFGGGDSAKDGHHKARVCGNSPTISPKVLRHPDYSRREHFANYHQPVEQPHN